MLDRNFWSIFWICITTAVITLITTISGCVKDGREREGNIVKLAIDKGIDPIIAKCAAQQSDSSYAHDANAVCIAAIMSAKK